MFASASFIRQARVVKFLLYKYECSLTLLLLLLMTFDDYLYNSLSTTGFGKTSCRQQSWEKADQRRKETQEEQLPKIKTREEEEAVK